jgi:enoyl-CoA hydratase/carnithine racemase
MSLDEYKVLDVSVADGIAEVHIVAPGYSERGHYEWSRIWRDLDEDPEVRVALLEWAIPDDVVVAPRPRVPDRNGSQADYFAKFTAMARNGREAIYGVINMDKPLVSAIKGQMKTGAGFAVSLLADISVASETVVLSDSHVLMGLAAGDQGVFWPLLCGMTKAKRYLMTGDKFTGREAEEMGFITHAVPEGEVKALARQYAERFANGPQNAIRFTKRALNQWFRQAGVTAFDFSLALEGQNFYDGDFDALMAALEAGTESTFRYPSIDVRIPTPE